MIKIDLLEIAGFYPAIHGMRNPKNSWNLSDSRFTAHGYSIGERDMNLMSALANAGSEHRKFDRMTIVWMDIDAPLYWWKEFDTYKIGTVSNSCSTMHKIHAKKFTLDDFSHDHLVPYSLDMMQNVIDLLNSSRELFIETKDKSFWWQMIQLLPSSYNQRRTIMINYETAFRIYEQRKNHKLDEWHEMCDFILKLPYFCDIFAIKGDEK